MLEKRNKELIKEWNYLKERMYWYENEKAEEVSIQKEKYLRLPERKFKVILDSG